MKLTTLAAVAAVAFAMPAFADVTGVWRSSVNANGDSIDMKVAPCGSAMCGVIIAARGPSAEDGAVGKRMLWDMRPDGQGGYSGGRVWAADQDRTFRARMALKGGNILSLSGCVLGGVICRTEDFQRVN